jgi:hypothetical protein
MIPAAPSQGTGARAASQGSHAAVWPLAWQRPVQPHHSGTPPSPPGAPRLTASPALCYSASSGPALSARSGAAGRVLEQARGWP